MKYLFFSSYIIGALLLVIGNAIAAVSTVVQPDLANSSSPLACNGNLEYIPLPAFSASNYTEVKIVEGKLHKTSVNWPTTTAEINKLLPNISTQVAMIKGDASGTAGSFFGGKLHSEHITIDFMKYRSEAIEDQEGKVLAYGRIGAGMRLVIDLETSEATLGGSLIAIALSAKSGKTSGTISADIIGMDANDITLSVPFTTDLSEGSIQKLVEALAVVKTKFRDSNTTLTPQFMAKINCVYNIPNQSIEEKSVPLEPFWE